MEKRPAKETDQKEIEKCMNYLNDCMNQHSEVEPTLWASAFWSILASGYNESGISYAQFSKELKNVRLHFKHWFDK